nr:MAG TPA: hypothetical protein [Caudoviricetes sp.]
MRKGGCFGGRPFFVFKWYDKIFYLFRLAGVKALRGLCECQAGTETGKARQ